jgi:type IV pilus assembly protein PilP
VIAVLLLWIAGCGGGGPTVPGPAKGKAPVAKKKAEAPPASERTEASKPEPEYAYNPTGKADPFKPFIQLNQVRRASGVPVTPLQRYEVSQLKLVAIIASREGNVALVEDSAGKGFFLKKGTLVGKNDGKVTKILKDRVIIEELYQDIYGKGKNAEVSLYLYRPEEEVAEQ